MQSPRVRSFQASVCDSVAVDSEGAKSVPALEDGSHDRNRSRSASPFGRGSSRARAAGCMALVGLLAMQSACGPFGYIRKVTREANRAYAEAEAVGAEEAAPYEFYGAQTYLEQARTMMGYSEFERAFDYGSRAKQLAEAATKTAKRVREGKSVQRVEEDDAAEGAEGTQPAADASASASGGGR